MSGPTRRSKSQVSEKQKQRSIAYQQLFHLPPDEILVDEFSCALQQKILLQGKLYISQNFACFYSNIFGSETIKILPASDITGVQLAKILFIPNSIKIFTTYESYFFASFLHRDDAYRLLTMISRGESIAHLSPERRKEEKEKEKEKSGRKQTGDENEHNDEDEDDGASVAESPRDAASGDIRSPASRHSLSPDRSPRRVNTSARHQSLLLDNEAKMRAEQERKRKEAIREAHRRISMDEGEQHEDEEDEGVRHRSEETAEEMGFRRRNCKTSSKRSVASPTSPTADEGVISPRRSRRSPPSPAINGDAVKDQRPTRRRSTHETDQIEEDLADLSLDMRRAGKKKKSKKKKYAEFLATASNSSPPPPSRSEQMRSILYARPATVDGGMDPAVKDVLSKFRVKYVLLPGVGSNHLDDPTRRVIHEAPLIRQGSWRAVTRWAILFSDHFILVDYDTNKKKERSNYKIKQQIPLKYLQVDMRPESFQLDALGGAKKKPKLPNLFRLLDNDPRHGKGIGVQYIVSVATEDEKLEWANKFMLAISTWHAHHATDSTQQQQTSPATDTSSGVHGAKTDAAATSPQPSDSFIDRSKPGWYAHFVRGTLPHAIITQDVPLFHALMTTKLKDHINDLDQEHYSLLHLCVLNNTPDLIPLLLSHGIDVSLRDLDGLTALHLSVLLPDRRRCFDCLMSTKAMNVGIWHPPLGDKTPLRYTSCLWLAAIHQHATNPNDAAYYIRALMRNAGPAARDVLDERSTGNDMTLLDYCCYNHGMEHIADLLLELGATVDLLNPDGLSPLSQACRAANRPMVTLLLRNGAQPNLRSFKSGLNSPIFYCTPSAAYPPASSSASPKKSVRRAYLECACELVSYGGRWQDAMRNVKDERARDLFPDPNAQAALRRAEEVWTSDKPLVVENAWESSRQAATTTQQNSRHDFESCCICQTEFTLVNKKEYCRRCGTWICGPCSSKRMLFVGAPAPGHRRGLSSFSAFQSGGRERVCDGCWNLTAHVARMSGVRRAAETPTIQRSSWDEQTPNGMEEAANMHASPETTASSAATAASKVTPPRRHEPSAFKSMKRMDVDSESEVEEAGEGQTRSSPDEEAIQPGSAATATSHADDVDSDASADEAAARGASAKAKQLESARAAQNKPNNSFGGRLLARLTSKRKIETGEASPAADKTQGAATTTAVMTPNADPISARLGQAGSPSDRGMVSPQQNGANHTRHDGDEGDDYTGSSPSPVAASAASATAASNRSVAAAPSRRRRTVALDSDSDSETSSLSTSSTDSDVGPSPRAKARMLVRQRKLSNAAASNKKQNFFQRGLASASVAVKSAGGKMKQAGESVGGAVRKFAATVQEKVSAAAAASSPSPEAQRNGVMDEEVRRAAAAREQRREAARQRLMEKERRAGLHEEAEEDEANAGSVKGSRGKAPALNNQMTDAKQTALRNQEMLNRMERRGEEMEDDSREFHTLVTRLKNKTKQKK